MRGVMSSWCVGCFVCFSLGTVRVLRCQSVGFLHLQFRNGCVLFLQTNAVHELQGCCIYMPILETHWLSRTRLFTCHCGRVLGFNVSACRFIDLATSIPRPVDLFFGIFHLDKFPRHHNFYLSTARAPTRPSLPYMSPSTTLNIMSG